ncbi:hypothetical protein [Flavobacterium sp. PL02]|uniref:hypothetical protein n=1 Tax=Flavobacterium sp. PL02 TaxID=3088354 RepID=UPI002B23B2EB|nr:hypothetical protein [Flavobacterium sp. PL02]MEA9414394.1 hypothetical protein [Flavobacterium sp. PL02]
MTDINTILSWFKTGLKPTQAQFWASWQSFWHKDEQIPQSSIANLSTTLNAKVEKSQFDGHIVDPNAHADLLQSKVDKVVGERLIKTVEIAKLAELENATTTIKSISSTALITQNVAGFVTYINALNPVLNVGVNETVKFKTDTGRIFELLLNDRNFGVGESPIVASDVLEITEFLNKDIQLSNYPSTRNDGQLPTNKVLSTDVNGNLKMYTIATAPAPFLEELIPDSHLPNATGNFILKGSFFTPTMTVVVQGQTLNYITFISDNELHVNLTTGFAEGMFDVTLDNGISKTFPKVLLIVLGTIYVPTPSDWVNIIQPIDFMDGSLLVKTIGAAGKAEYIKELDTSKKIRFNFTPTLSPFDPTPLRGSGTPNTFEIYDTQGNLLFWCYNYNNENLILRTQGKDTLGYFGIRGEIFNEIRIDYIDGIWYFYKNNILIYTSIYHNNMTTNAKVVLRVARFDLIKIKYIELAN